MVGLIFNTIGISDGITNGTDGMRYSLVSRKLLQIVSKVLFLDIIMMEL